MKIGIITAKTPFSLKESFILEEILEMNTISNVLIIPRDTKGRMIPEAKGVKVLAVPFFSLKIFASFFQAMTNHSFWQALKIIFNADNKKAILKNLAVLPKSIHLSKLLLKENISHIHAHWGGTTSTMALFIHLMTRIPFSITFHRWDINENNLILEKIKEANFVRTISNEGKNELQKHLPTSLHKKVIVIHMGVRLCEKRTHNKAIGTLKIVNVGNMVPEKNHMALFQILKLLKDRGIKFHADLFGDGPLRNKLENLCREFKILNNVTFKGHIPHAELLNAYERGEYFLMLSTSDIEGIPVALMEAMAYGIPVIANNVGGISELISDGKNGFLIENNNPEAIAKKIISLLGKEKELTRVRQEAVNQIQKKFNIQISVEQLLKQMK